MRGTITWICASLLLLPFIVLPQHTGRITGIVTDGATGSPVPFASVLLRNTVIGTSSGIDGTFDLKRVPAGRWDVLISVIGYDTVFHPVEVTAGATIHLPISLTEHSLVTDVVVISSDRPTSAASSSMIRAMDFELRPRLSSQDLLRLAPGLVIAQHAGGGKAEQIFLRGFDADHGTDVNISVDGIPVNMVSHAHGQGYADLHFVMPEVLRGLEVYKGPYFAQAGDFGTAGTVRFNTLDEVDHSTLSVETGMFGLLRTVGILSIPTGSESVTGYLAGEVMQNRSYFDNDQKFHRFNLFGKMKIHLDMNRSITVWGSGFRSDWDASGQIPQRAIDRGIIGRYGAIDPSEGGITGRDNLNVIYTENDLLSHLTVQGYLSRYFFTLFSNFTLYKNDPVNGDGIEQSDDRVISGGRIEYGIHSLFGNPDIRTVFGGTLRRDDITNQLWNEVSRKRTGRIADAVIDQTSISFYVLQQYRLTDALSMEAGLRNDHFIFTVDDRLNGGTVDDISGTVTRSILSPKVNFILSPADHVNIFLNAGSGFHSNDARGVLTERAGKTLPRAIGTEAGVRYTPHSFFSVSAALWRLDLENELVYVGDEGTTEASGATRRIGIDTDVRLQLMDWIWWDADVTFSSGRFLDLPAGEDHIPLAPTVTASAGMTMIHPTGMEGTIRLRHVGDRAANESNTVQALGYSLIDAGLSYSFGRFRLTMTAENIFDQEWNEAQFDTESRLLGETLPVSELHFTPGTPRSVRLKLEAGW
jgi:hypothetical protein